MRKLKRKGSLIDVHSLEDHMVTWMAWPHGPEFDHENPRQTGGQLHFHVSSRESMSTVMISDVCLGRAQ